MLPLIFTLRTVEQGGRFPADATQHATSLYREGLRMGFDFVDLELTAAPELKDYVLNHRKMCTIIVSHHDVKGSLSWSNGGVDWLAHLDAAREYGDVVKFIGAASSPKDNDDLKVFKNWVAAEHPDVPLIAMNMFDFGKMSRVNNGFMTPVTHPALPAKAAPGQLSAAEIRRVLGIVGEIPTKKFYLFGMPIQMSRSPALHNTLFSLTGLPHEYDIFETDRVQDVADLIRAPDFGGASVTIPLKLDIMPMLDVLDPAAQTIGAVNTVVPSVDDNGKTILTGYNTDWQGMVLCLRSAGANGSVSGSTQAGMVVGGGGTARAAIYALKEMGCSPIYVVGRNKEKLTKLTQSFPADYNVRVLSSEAEAKALPVAQQPTIAIGTIPGYSTLDDELKAILSSIFRAASTAATSDTVSAENGSKVLLEMSYKPSVTPLMELASRSGWKTVPGLEPLVGQGVHQFKLWTDIMPLYSVSRDAVLGSAA